MEQLVKQIIDCATAYYHDGSSPISDEDFDQLIVELREQDPDHWVLNAVGWGAKHFGKKQAHIAPVEGLDEVKYPADPLSYASSVIGPKLDGLSIFSYIAYGELVLAITRGDKEYGVIRTDKVSRILGIRLAQIRETCKHLPLIVVRGEVSVNLKYKQGILDRGFPNIRNYAAGIMSRVNDYSEIYMLDYVVYTPIASQGIVFHDKCQFYNFAADAGFMSLDGDVNFMPKEDRAQVLLGLYAEYALKYEIDGVVLTKRQLPYTIENTGHEHQLIIYHEDSAKYKFPGEKINVNVTGVDWVTGPSGRIAPTAEFESVFLSGANLSRASAFNADFVKCLGIQKGAILQITRANDVIPHILKSVEKVRQPVILPWECPSCGHALVWKGLDLFCNNKHVCPAQTRQVIYHFMVAAGQPDGIGKTTIDKMLGDLGTHSLFSFITFLNENKVSPNSLMDKFGESYGYLLWALIHNCKEKILKGVTNSEFWRLLNLDKLGVTTARNMSGIDPRTIETRGQVRPKLLGVKVQFPTLMAIEQNFEHWSSLLKVLPIHTPTGQATILEGFKICVTGSVNSFKNRNRMLEVLRELGADATDKQVTRDTDYLICNVPSTSNKYKKAESVPGCSIVTEEQFFDILSVDTDIRKMIIDRGGEA